MTAFDFTRSVKQDLIAENGMLLNAILDFTRDDEATVDFSGKTIKMEIYDRKGGVLLDTLTSGAEITIATARLIILKRFTELSLKAYYFHIFNDSDKEGIQHGNLIVI